MIDNISNQNNTRTLHFKSQTFMNKYDRRGQINLLTYSIYFSYAIFLTDYKNILKITDGVKPLPNPLLPDPNCSMPENDAQCVIPVKCCISFKTMLRPNFLMQYRY